MKKSNSKRTAQVQFADEHLTIGMDVSDAFTNSCVLNRHGEVVIEGRFATTRTGLSKFAGDLPQSRIALEVGINSPWMSRQLSAIGHEVNVPLDMLAP